MSETPPPYDAVGLLMAFAKAPSHVKPLFKKAPKSRVPNHSPMRFFAKGYSAASDREAHLIERLASLPDLAAEDIEIMMAPLNSMTGLGNLKKTLLGVIRNLQVQKIRSKADLIPRATPLHFVFTGPPGTGKTTAARHLAKILHECGYCKTPKFREVARADLVGQYVGETDVKTKQILKDIKGGVLFIDEAYSLNGDGRDYGPDVINQLVAEMEKPDFDTVIVCAGYEAPMQLFMASNPGFRSRFTHIVSFNAYKLSELLQIITDMAEEAQYHLDEQAIAKLEHILRLQLRKGTLSDGNARYARKLLDESITNQSERILRDPGMNLRDLVTILPRDIPGPNPEKTAKTDRKDGDQGNVVPFGPLS